MFASMSLTPSNIRSSSEKRVRKPVNYRDVAMGKQHSNTGGVADRHRRKTRTPCRRANIENESGALGSEPVAIVPTSNGEWSVTPLRGGQSNNIQTTKKASGSARLNKMATQLKAKVNDKAKKGKSGGKQVSSEGQSGQDNRKKY